MKSQWVSIDKRHKRVFDILESRNKWSALDLTLKFDNFQVTATRKECFFRAKEKEKKKWQEKSEREKKKTAKSEKKPSELKSAGLF